MLLPDPNPTTIETTTGAADPRDTLDTIVQGPFSYTHARKLALAEFERRYVEHALAASGGSVARAAAAAGIARRHFNRILARHRRRAA